MNRVDFVLDLIATCVACDLPMGTRHDPIHFYTRCPRCGIFQWDGSTGSQVTREYYKKHKKEWDKK